MNPDFIFGQLRVAAVAIIAYLSGRGIFTPADATLATGLLTALGPILAPWLASIYATYGTVKVGTGSVAAQVAVTEQKIAAIVADPETPSPSPQQVTAALTRTVTEAVKETAS